MDHFPFEGKLLLLNAKRNVPASSMVVANRRIGTKDNVHFNDVWPFEDSYEESDSRVSLKAKSPDTKNTNGWAGASITAGAAPGQHHWCNHRRWGASTYSVARSADERRYQLNINCICCKGGSFHWEQIGLALRVLAFVRATATQDWVLVARSPLSDTSVIVLAVSNRTSNAEEFGEFYYGHCEAAARPIWVKVSI